jgi:HlyD family secretion protein
MAMPETDLSKLKIDRDARGSRSKPRRRVPSWLTAVVVILAIASIWAVRSITAPVAVESATVSMAYLSQSYTMLNAAGYVVAQRKAAVASKATGRLEWLGVREGSRVREHEVIARLENRDVTAAMEQAAASIKLAQANLEQGQAELNEAERNFNRSRDLLAKNFVSQSAHDVAVSRLEKARAAISGYKASIAMAQANYRATQVGVEQTLIRAPFEGVVLTKNANVGDVITPFSSALGSQAAVVTMADMSTLEVEADVSESNLGKVTLGQPCEIQLDALPDARFRGRLLRMVPTVDRSKATIMAKIRFEQLDPRILPEMSAKVAFLSQEVPEGERAARAAVQPAAITQRNGRSVVFVIKDDKVTQIGVETGAKLGELVEVRSGVKLGDKVVLRPPDKLHDGARVALPAK